MAIIRVRLLSGLKVDLGPSEQIVVWKRGAGAPPTTLHSSRVDEQDKQHPINLKDGAPVLVYRDTSWQGGYLEK